MKVLMINSVCGIRSTGRICTDIADVLMANGHECRVAYGREQVPEKYKDIAVRIGTDLDVKLHGVQTRLLDRHGYGSKAATKKFIRWVKEYDPDVIHLHNIHGYYIHIGVLFDYLKTCGKRIIWTFHDCWAFTGHCSHFVHRGCERWRSGCYECPLKKTYPISMGLDRSKKNYREKKQWFTAIPNMTIVTPSKWLADLVKQSFFMEYDVLRISNGIDLTAFQPVPGTFRERFGLQKKKIVLGVSSVWTESKGYPDYLKLAKILPEDYCVVLVGVTPEQKAALPENIVGITRTNDVAELAQIYTCADVFVNMTYLDTYPTVNLEAQACGTPVITYRTGGSPESLDASCGWVLEQGNVQAVADAILRVENWENYSEYCKKRSAAFDKKRMCQDYIGIYQK